MTDEQLKAVITEHENFLTYAEKLASKTAEEPEPPVGVCANLADSTIEGANLSFVNLAGANAARVKGSRADLRAAKLTASELTSADLSRAALNNANLVNANLAGANLSRADLRHANLEGADLSGANLEFADLRGANLNLVNLSGANLGNTGLLLFQFERHQAYYMGGDLLNIGGAIMPITEWQEKFVDVAIANAYTEQQIAMYSQFIEGLAKSLQLPPPAEEV